jgi:predicted metal-dependent hydrolase
MNVAKSSSGPDEMTQRVLPFSERPRAEAPRSVRVGDRVHLVRFVRVRRARRYVLRMRPDGTLRVAVPPFGTLSEAAAFVRSQAAWIARQRVQALRVAADQPSAEERAALRERAMRELPPRLLELAARHGFTVTRATVRAQRTLWGSCSRSRASVSLNWRLVRMPDEIRDYILLHELAHLRHADHSKAFWKLVATICPTYRDAHRWLRRHGHTL